MSSFKTVTVFFNFSYSRVVKKFQKTVFDTIARKKDEITSNFIFFLFWCFFTCKPKISKIWVGEGQTMHPNIYINIYIHIYIQIYIYIYISHKTQGLFQSPPHQYISEPISDFLSPGLTFLKLFRRPITN